MRFKAARTAVSRISPKLTHAIMYYKAMGKSCDLKDPRTFNEKVSWLKLNELPNDPLASYVTDKYLVREWVKQRGCGGVLVKLYGAWDSASDVCCENLPERFVLKCNHGCGMNIICNDKSKFDVEQAKLKLDEWMHTDWSLLSAESHYGTIDRKIICEEYVEGPLSDYKFYCFSGEPCYYYVSEGLENGPTTGRISFFEMGGAAPFTRSDHQPLNLPYPNQPNYFD